jgi:hypothetical protein
MLTFHRKHGRRPDEFEPDPAVDDCLTTVTVLLSPGLVELAPSLGQALGPGFRIETDHSGACHVLIVGPVGPAGVAFLRASHRGAALLVVDRRWPTSWTHAGEAVVHLEAGADGYLLSPPVSEVASHVRALIRRADLQVNGGAASPAERRPASAA